MKEYDLDSYSRKWRGCFGVFTTAKDERKYGNFVEFLELARGVYGVDILHPDGQNQRFVLEREYDDYPVAKIEYYPFLSGWYKSTRNGLAMLIRKHSRGFCQGLTHNTHDLVMYDSTGKNRTRDWGKFQNVKVFERPEYTKLDPDQPFGVMSARVWWNGGVIAFLNRTIGFYFPDGKVSLENPAFVPYIQPYLGDKCRIA